MIVAVGKAMITVGANRAKPRYFHEFCKDGEGIVGIMNAREFLDFSCEARAE
jgi:hypothetical protein